MDGCSLIVTNVTLYTISSVTGKVMMTLPVNRVLTYPNEALNAAALFPANALRPATLLLATARVVGVATSSDCSKIFERKVEMSIPFPSVKRWDMSYQTYHDANRVFMADGVWASFEMDGPTINSYITEFDSPGSVGSNVTRTVKNLGFGLPYPNGQLAPAIA